MGDLLQDAWGKLLAPAADVLWNSLFLWRTVALVVVTAAVVAVAYRRELLDYFINRQERRAHDREIFQRLSACLSEERLRAEIDMRFSNDRTTLGFQTTLEEFLETNGLAGNRFLSRPCQASIDKLRTAIDNLLTFMGSEFDVTRPSADENAIIRLRPDLNMDFAREPSNDKTAEYFRKNEELRTLVTRVDEAHRRYRKSIKEQLLL